MLVGAFSDSDYDEDASVDLKADIEMNGNGIEKNEDAVGGDGCHDAGSTFIQTTAVGGEISKDSLVEKSNGSSEDGAEIKQGIRLLLSNRQADFRAFALECGMLPETLADRINEAAIEAYGDIAVEIGDGFVLIDDYRNELTNMI